MFLVHLVVLLLSSFSSLHPQVFKNVKETSFVKRIPIGFSWWAPADDDWRLGTGSRTTYSAMFNEFGLQAGAFVRLNITRQHAIFIGAGPLYAVEVCTFEPKYGSKKTVTQRGTALFCTAGYNFQMKDNFSLFIEFEYEHFITEGLINVIVPTAGITFGL